MKWKGSQMLTLSFVLLSFYATACRVMQPPTRLVSQNDQTIYLPFILTPLLAFPGAEGFGALSVGGRGGRVIKVTNLNDSGPGSFRAALRESGPRIIVFQISGTIQATHTLAVTNPFVTIAGQTAPGPGITLQGASLSIKTHDVIVRGLRVRVGDQLAVDQGAPDGIRVEATPDSPVYNIIIDHCSISWAIDENLSTYQQVRNITFQWNIISEGLKASLHPEGSHSMGLLIYEHAKRISIHHNLFAHNDRRNPRLGADTEVEVINNVVYNWGEAATHIADDNEVNLPSFANLIGNFYKPGLDTATANGIEVKANMPPGTRIYVRGNIDLLRTDDVQDDWAAVAGDAAYRSAAPALAPSGIRTHDAFAAYELVLQYAGATYLNRDAIDERIVRSVQSGGGHQINSQQEVGGWVAIPSVTAPRDTDEDGMPDLWEVAQGLNPNDATDGAWVAPSRYTYIEEYINSLLPMPGR